MKKIVTKLLVVVFFSFFYPLDLEVITQQEPMINDKVVLRLRNLIFLQEFFENDTVEVQKYLSLSTFEPKKVVLISIPKQELIVLDFIDTFKVALQTKVSTGLGKKWTPTGEFKILEKLDSRPSHKYGGTMLFWNCIISTPKVAIGIHSLKNNKDYEKYLGKPASHGCIRISTTVAPTFYALVPIGTPVFIE